MSVLEAARLLANGDGALTGWTVGNGNGRALIGCNVGHEVDPMLRRGFGAS